MSLEAMSPDEHAQAIARLKADDGPVMPLAMRGVVAESQIEPYTDYERAGETGIRQHKVKQTPRKADAPRGPLAETMEALAAQLGVEIVWPDDRNPTADELRALPSTERLEAELTRCQDDVERWGAGRTSGLGWESRRLRLKIAERQVRWGWIRDKVVAGMTEDCMCCGDGKVFVPALIHPEKKTEIEPSYWTYCPCQAGDALRASHGKARRMAEERRTHAIESAIFDLGGDDFAEYATVSLDSYRERLEGYTRSAASAGRLIASDLTQWAGADQAWLVLRGPTGTGKTGLAVSLLKMLASRGQRGLIVREKSMLDRIRATYNRQRGSDEPTETDVLDELRRVPVLVMDDVAAPGSATSEWAQGQLFDVLNSRYSARRRTIMTTNLANADLEAYLGPRIWSRLWERTQQGEWVKWVVEPDLRRGVCA